MRKIKTRGRNRARVQRLDSSAQFGLIAALNRSPRWPSPGPGRHRNQAAMRRPKRRPSRQPKPAPAAVSAPVAPAAAPAASAASATAATPARGRRIVWPHVVDRDQRHHPDRRRGVRRRLRRLLGARHAVRLRLPRRAHPRRHPDGSAAWPSWCSSCARRISSSRSPRAAERARCRRSSDRDDKATSAQKIKEDLARGELNLLHRAQNLLFRVCPISHVPVAVCRSVGSRTRGRPAAWREEPKLSKKSDRQPEAKPAHPALSRGRGLKQRRSGLLWSLPASTAGDGSPTRLVHLANSAAGSPLQSEAATAVES